MPLDALAQNRRSQGDVAGRDGFHVDGHWQVGQGKAARFQRRAAVRGRHPVQQDVAGRELVDDDLAGQQRRLAPVQRHIADGQPDALIIGDRHLGHGCLGGQSALKAGDCHDAAGIRQVFLQKPRQEILVGLLRHRRPRQRHKGDDPQRPHQNACPSPT